MKMVVLVLAVGLAGAGALLVFQSRRADFFTEAERQHEAWRKAAQAGDEYEAERLRGKARDTLETLGAQHARLAGYGFGLVAAGIALAGLGLQGLRCAPAGPAARVALSSGALALGCVGAALAASALVWMPDWAEVERAVDEESANWGLPGRQGPNARAEHDELWSRRNMISKTLQDLLLPAMAAGILGFVPGAIGYFRRWGALSAYAAALGFFGLATGVCGAVAESGELSGTAVIGLAALFAAIAVFLARGRRAVAAAPA